MADLSRRTLLIGGGTVLAAAVAGGGAVMSRASPAPSMPVPTTTSSAPPTSPAPSASTPAAPAPPAIGTTPLAQLGLPAPLLAIPTLAIPGTMQDVVALPSAGVIFVTQKESGSSGSEQPYETTVVNRVQASDGRLLDAMVLIDAGHGLGFEVEAAGDGTWIWMTWHGASADSQGREQDFVRLRYTPGTFTRGQADQQLGLTLVPFQDRTPEAVYHFDWARDSAVERHWNPAQGAAACTETYIRRRISDLKAGLDAPLGSILLRATPPTTQGFATVNDTLFRWLGAAGSGGAQNPADPITLEQYSWATGQLVSTGAYAGIWQPWEDGDCEPQGLSVVREADGTASLILGLATGLGRRHRYKLSKLTGIGAA